VVRVSTVPEAADVYVGYDGGQPAKVGQTPLKLESDLISQRKGRFVTLTLKKEGFQTETVILPTSQFGADLSVTSKLDEYKLSMQCHDQNTAIQKVSRGTASVQYLIKAGRFTEALGQIDVLLSEFPGVSVLFDLKGNVLYLSKDLSGALAAYDKSVELDPTNTDTQRIRAKIRGILGDRAPVSRGGQ
jgi:tetratricopeptide (TPR) repeat protein